MHHRINGIPVNLRELTQHELDALVRMAEERIEAADDDLEKLKGEQVRRSHYIASIFEH